MKNSLLFVASDGGDGRVDGRYTRVVDGGCGHGARLVQCHSCKVHDFVLVKAVFVRPSGGRRVRRQRRVGRLVGPGRQLRVTREGPSAWRSQRALIGWLHRNDKI